MRQLNSYEISQVHGGQGMSTQCIVEGGLNMIGTAGALGVAIGSGGAAAIVAGAASVQGWLGWYRDCGPAANYGNGGGSAGSSSSGGGGGGGVKERFVSKYLI